MVVKSPGGDTIASHAMFVRPATDDPVRSGIPAGYGPRVVLAGANRVVLGIATVAEITSRAKVKFQPVGWFVARPPTRCQVAHVAATPATKGPRMWLRC
jgi:hypothetical protein